MVRAALASVRGAVARVVDDVLDYNDRWVMEVHEPWQDAGSRVRCGGPHRARVPDWPCPTWTAAADRRAARRRRRDPGRSGTR
ncbi:hypothetical protein [Puerhibacterium puerhi]|uniref:hypothetical protein n=1 Tax=Puerhibacterium puerhi TaxID=2692623 RepID=UPI00135AAEBC|nr:hypothetical protein [Puerhibacterium puerhi]